MSLVRTVLGDIDASVLGVCYAHEHLIIDASYAAEKYPDFALPSIENGVAELREFYANGGRAMVDSMPCDSGRNVRKLSEISQQTGVHIVAPTGLHLQKYYPQGHWGTRLREDQLADLFVADIEQGIDAHDYNGPVVERTPHRAGIIKVAGGKDKLSAHEQKLFRAAVQAHVRTGAPILTHTEQGTAAIEQAELLIGNGVSPTSIVLSHTDRQPNLAYHRAILSAGIFVEFDSAFRWKTENENPTRDLIMALFEAGYGAQVMLGMDAARPSYWKNYGGAPGLSFLLTEFSVQLRAAGLGDNELHQIFVTNPARAFVFHS